MSPSRLDSDGVLWDSGWQNPKLAMDALNVRPAPMPVEEALRAAREQQAKRSPLAKLIPGYDRLR